MIKIAKRKLSTAEIGLLIEEIKKFPNPITGKKTWQSIKRVYIVSSKNNLIGVCSIKQRDNWVKLGPFVVFEKYHRQGYGRKIMETIMKDYSKSNLFIGSRNPAVAKISMDLGFQEMTNPFLLPNTIKLFLIGYIFQSLNLECLQEFIRKKPTKEGPYRFFLKPIRA